MKLIIIPLFFLIMISICVQMANFTPISSTYSTNISVVENSPLNFAYTVTILGGFLGFFIGIVVIGVLIGIDVSIFGSTFSLSPRSQNIAYNALFYGGLWGIFSVTATVGINGLGLFSIPLEYSGFMYIILTLIYVLGINQQIQSGAE